MNAKRKFDKKQATSFRDEDFTKEWTENVLKAVGSLREGYQSEERRNWYFWFSLPGKEKKRKLLLGLIFVFVVPCMCLNTSVTGH